MKCGNPHTIQTQPFLKYLEVLLENKLSFQGQLQRSRERAASLASLISRLMADIGGPASGKRRLLMFVANSLLLYGTEVWADAAQIKKRRHKISYAQRLAILRIFSA